jgi:catechol 2,3-dioxygenase-like lactoylglutathione lyase family enzyme
MTRLLSIHVRLPAPDLRRQVRFYVDALDFAVVALWPDADAPQFLALQRDEIVLEFYTPHDGHPPLCGSFVLRTDDAQALISSCRACGPIRWGPELYSYGAREFCVEDPAGHQVIVSETVADAQDSGAGPAC